MQIENKTELKITCRIVDVICAVVCAGNSNVRQVCRGEVNEQLRYLTTNGIETGTTSVYSQLIYSIEDAVLRNEPEDGVG
jgi:hypothetical protein